jgi:hypothetical protein
MIMKKAILSLLFTVIVAAITFWLFGGLTQRTNAQVGGIPQGYIAWCTVVTGSNSDYTCSDDMGNCYGIITIRNLYSNGAGTDAIKLKTEKCMSGHVECGTTTQETMEKVENVCCPAGQTNPHFVCNNGNCEQVNYCGTSTEGCEQNGAECACAAQNYKPHLECRNGVCTLINTCGQNSCTQEHLSCGGGSGGCPSCSYSPTGYYCPYGIDFSCWPQYGCPNGFVPVYAYNCCCMWSPIILDVNGDGFNFTNAENGVLFDAGGIGIKSRIAWPAAGSDDAWLALDRNGNGQIDTGLELFGNFTIQSAVQGQERNGFLALAEFDTNVNGGNNNGKIDSSDAVFSLLRLWQDINHNGISEASELSPLSASGINGIDLKYKESKKTDSYGNEFKYRGKILTTQSSNVAKWAYDVFPKLINQ